VAPWHQIHPIPRGWLSENILAARLGEDFSLDIPFHRTGFTSADAILPKGHECSWAKGAARSRLTFSISRRPLLAGRLH